MLNRNTLWELAKVKDNNGNYIWQEGAREGTPAMLFGKSYILNDDVADIGAGAASVLFGDFSKYKIRIGEMFYVVMVDEFVAAYLSIGLFGFARVDGTLLDAGTHPVQKLIHATA